MDGLIAYVLAKKSFSSGTISSITTNQEEGTLDFEFQDGNKKSVAVPGGVSITSVSIDEKSHLICSLSDGTKIDAGELPTGANNVVVVENFSELEEPGKENILYIVSSENALYYWDTDKYNKLNDTPPAIAWKKF